MAQYADMSVEANIDFVADICRKAAQLPAEPEREESST